MNPKIHTPSPLESSEDLHLPKSEPKPSVEPQERTGRKAGGRRNWLDGSMIGQKFGLVTVVGKGYSVDIKRKTFVPCKCECGGIEDIQSTILLRGPGCKCCRSERASKRMRTHGQEPKHLYKVWSAMKERCYNPNNEHWDRYGGRGISMCPRWLRFENFRDDMGDRPSNKHSVDRIDNDLNYSPENCRWATSAEQNRNRSNNWFITAFGVSKIAVDWEAVYGVKATTIRARIKKGWVPEKAVSSPVK